MFDLKQPVTYRSFEANDAAFADGVLVGCRVESVTALPIAGEGYTEKRARADGLDAVDVYLGGLRLRLAGIVYGTSRADTFDRVDALRAAFSPTLAYSDDNSESGYVPLTFSRPTDRTDDYASGQIDLFVNVRPISAPQIAIAADRSGGVETEGFGVTWSVDLEAKDPRFYVATAKTIDISGATSGSGTFANNGTYPAPLTFTLNADTGDDTVFRFIGLGADVSLEIPDLAGPCTLTCDGNKKIVTLDYGGQELLRMDLIVTEGEVQYPEAPAGGGGAFSWTTSGSVQLLEGSVISYYEAYT